ncbi:MAG: hypothetical protein AVDCRST_MAG80-1942 [uncultured Rubrobacteraceae bacterium]|uniref:Uncharacterized protein n=1 Tax=uncultured Rubrobacteraceae bacterium TaxID=349277 RepID=A0A6J4QKV3_9ACTN|nr:MAG: hypothetical protein AVDCRST_MAG80-1942 [uncultured Rubrobacteraceae bacterium]
MISAIFGTVSLRVLSLAGSSLLLIFSASPPVPAFGATCRSLTFSVIFLSSGRFEARCSGCSCFSEPPPPEGLSPDDCPAEEQAASEADTTRAARIKTNFLKRISLPLAVSPPNAARGSIRTEDYTAVTFGPTKRYTVPTRNPNPHPGP